jgi:N-acetylglutamate synthase-like GNAT family acetyltransferase
MNVERVNASDIESVLHVINTSNSDSYRSLIPLEQFKDPILTLEELMTEFSNMRFYTYKLANKFVGVAALQIDEGETGIVRWVHVLPEHRRKGVGSSLMEHVENEAKYLGLKRLRVVYVWERAYWAKNFYAKLGYQKRDTVTLPWGDTAHIYERILH